MKLRDLFTAQLCISQLKPRFLGHSGELNIYPALKDDLFPHASGPSSLLKAPYSVGIQTPKTIEETIQLGIVRLGHVAKVKLYLFSLLSLKTPGSTEIVICCKNWPSNIRESKCTSRRYVGLNKN